MELGEPTKSLPFYYLPEQVSRAVLGQVSASAFHPYLLFIFLSWCYDSCQFTLHSLLRLWITFPIDLLQVLGHSCPGLGVTL